MSKKDELLGGDILKEIAGANKVELEKLVVNCGLEARKYERLMKEDQQLQELIEDKKALEGGYKDQIKACKLKAEIALSRLENKEE